MPIEKCLRKDDSEHCSKKHDCISRTRNSRKQHNCHNHDDIHCKKNTNYSYYCDDKSMFFMDNG